MTLLGLLILLIIGGIVAFLFLRYVVPAVPVPFQKPVVAVAALIVIILILQYTFGGGVNLNTPIRVH